MKALAVRLILTVIFITQLLEFALVDLHDNVNLDLFFKFDPTSSVSVVHRLKVSLLHLNTNWKRTIQRNSIRFNEHKCMVAIRKANSPITTKFGKKK